MAAIYDLVKCCFSVSSVLYVSPRPPYQHWFTLKLAFACFFSVLTMHLSLTEIPVPLCCVVVHVRAEPPVCPCYVFRRKYCCAESGALCLRARSHFSCCHTVRPSSTSSTTRALEVCGEQKFGGAIDRRLNLLLHSEANLQRIFIITFVRRECNQKLNMTCVRQKCIQTCVRQKCAQKCAVRVNVLKCTHKYLCPCPTEIMIS